MNDASSLRAFTGLTTNVRSPAEYGCLVESASNSFAVRKTWHSACGVFFSLAGGIAPSMIAT